MTLFAFETAFWLQLKLWDLACWDQEQRYAADDVPEVYSNKCFPSMNLTE